VIKMNKIILFLLILCSLSFSVLGVESNNFAYETEFIVDGKFEIHSTIINEFNKGQFEVNSYIPSVFRIDVLHLQIWNYRGGYTDIDLTEFHECFNVNLSTANTPLYSACETFVNDTGFHYITLNVTDNNGDSTLYIFQTIEIIDKKIDPLSLVFILIGVIIIIGGFYTKYPEVISLGLIPLITGLILEVVDYIYLIGYNLSAGIIGVLILFLFINMYYTFIREKA